LEILRETWNESSIQLDEANAEHSKVAELTVDMKNRLARFNAVAAGDHAFNKELAQLQKIRSKKELRNLPEQEKCPSSAPQPLCMITKVCFKLI